MARETIYQAIILKKQPLGESDEIITVFTREQGKLRVLAKSVRAAKSKLQYSLQTLFFIRLAVAAKTGMPRVIGAEVLESFANIRINLEAANAAFYALELSMKFTPDEQKNEGLFNLLFDFFHFLGESPKPESLFWGLAKFKVSILDVLGFGIHYNKNLLQTEDLGFSNSLGSFTTENTIDYFAVRLETLSQFLKATQSTFESFEHLPAEDLKQLQALLSGFINYHLERDIKSERFLEV